MGIDDVKVVKIVLMCIKEVIMNYISMCVGIILEI